MNELRKSKNTQFNIVHDVVALQKRTPPTTLCLIFQTMISSTTKSVLVVLLRAR
jgi:hypothetical protein